jgi:hypothetical protein
MVKTKFIQFRIGKLVFQLNGTTRNGTKCDLSNFFRFVASGFTGFVYTLEHHAVQ